MLSSILQYFIPPEKNIRKPMLQNTGKHWHKWQHFDEIGLMTTSYLRTLENIEINYVVVKNRLTGSFNLFIFYLSKCTTILICKLLHYLNPFNATGLFLPENIRMPLVSWYFQGVMKKRTVAWNEWTLCYCSVFHHIFISFLEALQRRNHNIFEIYITIVVWKISTQTFWEFQEKRFKSRKLHNEQIPDESHP